MPSPLSQALRLGVRARARTPHAKVARSAPLSASVCVCPCRPLRGLSSSGSRPRHPPCSSGLRGGPRRSCGRRRKRARQQKSASSPFEPKCRANFGKRARCRSLRRWRASRSVFRALARLSRKTRPRERGRSPALSSALQLPSSGPRLSLSFLSPPYRSIEERGRSMLPPPFAKGRGG